MGDHQMTETSRKRRPNKAFLGRIKILAVILSIVAFVGSLAGVAIANPATANRTVQVAQGVAISPASGIQAPSSIGGLVIPAQPQMPRIRPMTRTRGS
jgi:hypothetical protein